MDHKLTSPSQAIHEAGHAVMLYHFGVRILDVRIDPADDCITNEGKTTADDAKALALNDEDQAIIFLAGFVADCLLAGNPVLRSDFTENIRYASDREKLARVLKRCYSVSAGDEDNDEIFDLPVEGWLISTAARVADPLIWRAIVGLAGSLEDKHQLTGAGAMMVIIQHLSAT